jgi:hypothetical protein
MIVFAAGLASAIMMLSGIGLLIYILMRKAHLEQVAERRTRVVTEVPVLPRPKPAWQTDSNNTEVLELARDVNGQLTTKIIVLERLIADSQQQIELMEQLLERIERAKKCSDL